VDALCAAGGSKAENLLKNGPSPAGNLSMSGSAAVDGLWKSGATLWKACASASARPNRARGLCRLDTDTGHRQRTTDNGL
jgi:hypothetical protein